MNQRGSLLSSGFALAWRDKRFIFWFWLLNLTLAELGDAAFRNHIHPILDSSLQADRLLHGFDLPAYLELIARPEMGPRLASTAPAFHFAFVFFLVTLLFLPGVLLAYTEDRRLPREEFFRACGRNLWRFVRLTLWFAIVAVPLGGALFALHHVLVKAAEKSTNEVLPFYTIVATLGLIFLAMTFLRLWFDLAQVDVVVRDRNMTRKSVGSAWRYSWRYLGPLLGSYLAIALAAGLVLALGIWVWRVVVPPASVRGAFLVGQVILIGLLSLRFWQRAAAAAFYMREMLVAPSLSPAPLASSLPPVVPPPPPPPPEAESGGGAGI